MPFGMCNASATFQRAMAQALRKIVNREGSMVMAYIDDIVNAPETVEDHMVVFTTSAKFLNACMKLGCKYVLPNAIS